MEISGENFIGRKPSAQGSATFRAANPTFDADIDPTFYCATPQEVDQAMQLSDSAWAQYRARPARDRAAFLREIASQIEKLGDALISRAADETALPTARLVGERGRTMGQLRMFADLIEEGSWVDARIDQADANRKPAAKPDTRRMLVPIGPVVVFGASNFPLAFSVAGGDTASALAAGCTVVVKGHPSHPGTSELVAGAILKAADTTGAPDGVFSLLQGTDPQLSLQLVRHPLTQAVGFTGSHRAGRALFDAAAARPKPIPVHAEMGSINPIFLLPAALAERASQIAQGLSNSVLLGNGQFCTKPGVVVCMNDAATGEFIKHLSGLLSAAPAGTMLNRRIATSYSDGRHQRQDCDGIRLLAESSASTSRTTQSIPTLFTTTTDQFISNPALREELFGPSTLIVTVSSEKDLERIATILDGQLTATIHAAAGELAQHRHLVDILQTRAGRLIINGYPTGVEVCASMNHGGPYPASTDSRHTSVGTAAIARFARPLCFQDFPPDLLPDELQDRNPLGIWRIIDGKFQR